MDLLEDLIKLNEVLETLAEDMKDLNKGWSIDMEDMDKWEENKWEEYLEDCERSGYPASMKDFYVFLSEKYDYEPTVPDFVYSEAYGDSK